jgi:antitoxin (DNA-binding transcriptional repressor) of toxin-antitoxin stability system
MARKKKERRLPATHVRVHLGEVLRSLEREGDVVIERDGIPVARLVRYEPADHAARPPGVSKAADPSAWPRAIAAIRQGLTGIDGEQLIADIRRWREEGSRDRYEDRRPRRKTS